MSTRDDHEFRERLRRSMERNRGILDRLATHDRISESSEVRDETFWHSDGGFCWCWPRFHVYTPADTRLRCAFNRYPHNIIGAAIVVFGRCWGVQWKATRR